MHIRAETLCAKKSARNLSDPTIYVFPDIVTFGIIVSLAEIAHEGHLRSSLMSVFDMAFYQCCVMLVLNQTR